MFVIQKSREGESGRHLLGFTLGRPDTIHQSMDKASLFATTGTTNAVHHKDYIQRIVCDFRVEDKGQKVP